MTVTQFRPTDVSDYPDYPEALSDPAAANDYFTKFWHSRWLSSLLHLTGSLEVQAAALNLYFYARMQTPVGSLPQDERLLARLLRITDGQWHDLMAQDPNPLHGWSWYRHGGGLVRGHAVVIEVALDALDRRETRRLAQDEKAVRERQRRLVTTLERAGCSKAVTGDWPLVCWLDAWLEEHHRGQRRFPQIEHSVKRALHAAAEAGKLRSGR